MSFITKRDRVFNEYDLFDLPSRNEGKLKAYSSCTDARAWSHFGSDKTEHLVEVIKRNNETCRPKYVPTDVIVSTLMAGKNAELARLRRHVDEVEQLIAVYDQLDLTSEQKYEIANAHAAIKAANKELDELYLNLDVSNYTEGIDSEGFQTGKSSGEPGKGDEWQPNKHDKENQCRAGDLACPCDVSTNITDPRIDEMQEALISKDAKLGAMRNTIAVMENDVCEPYCIYAHIYTALEKIFGILCQNDKYKMYLNMLTTGKDTRSIDIKGKILFKLKVLEKFSVALVAPCSQENATASVQEKDSCACYRAQVETMFALASPEINLPSLDNKRAQLVADIMQNEEMKDILSKDVSAEKLETEPNDDRLIIEDYNIETENLKRLKNLQSNYDDLLNCYENLKHEKSRLEACCNKYNDLEKECQALQAQLREYNTLWNEKEHYRKRSDDLDGLKEQFLVLSDETSNLETQLKAESEINLIKSGTIDDLRSDNIGLEKRLNEATIAFEKEKNSLQCKLKEMECQIMCQGQQIKSLTSQIDRLLEHDRDKVNQDDDAMKSLVLLDEIEALRDQIKNLKDALYCSEEEKQQLQEQFEDKLKTINELKMEVEDWKGTYEKTLNHNDCLEKCAESFRDQIQRLVEENQQLTQDLEEKDNTVANLINIMNNKSHEMGQLRDKVDLTKKENRDLVKKVSQIQVSLSSNVNELQLARQESQELLEKVKNYDDIVHKKDDLSRSFEIQIENCKELQDMLNKKIEENRKLKIDLEGYVNSNDLLRQEISKLKDISNLAMDNLNELEDNKKQLENDLQSKSRELLDAFRTVALSRQESEDLSKKLIITEDEKQELMKVGVKYDSLVFENDTMQNELRHKYKELEDNQKALDELKKENEKYINEMPSLREELERYKRMHDEMMEEKNKLEHYLDRITEQNNRMADELKEKHLKEQISEEKLARLQNEQAGTLDALGTVKKRSDEMLDKLNYYQGLADELQQLKNAHDRMKQEKERLQNDLEKQREDLRKMERENNDLGRTSVNLVAHNKDLEEALIHCRSELMQSSPSKQDVSFTNILKKEVDGMKEENIANHKKIRDLIEQLEDYERIISNLNEDLQARNDKIAILENHINSLEDELRKLQNNLQVMLNTGEEMKDSYHKIDASLYTMDAHHSKATHNMKMELAKLQNENAKLEQQLSVTKLKSDESFQDRHKYASQIIHLQNEREIIITDIKQLELDSIGDSALSPDHCNTEDVLSSLDNIRRYLHAKTSKSNTLEQTILKVQTSSQLLLTKADEAKKIVEKEKQKIVNEKEDAVTAKSNMEKQLNDLRDRLEKQTTNDKAVIKDLEAEIANQKLIIDKINKSTQNYISKLEDELNHLRKLYQDALENMNQLQDKLVSVTDEKMECSELLKRVKASLDEKTRDISMLQSELNNVKEKSFKDTGIQGFLPSDFQSMSSQTHKTLQDMEKEELLQKPEDTLKENVSMGAGISDLNVMKIGKPHPDEKIVTDLLPKQKQPIKNEVQILSASVEPSFDFVRSNYLKYKLQRLSPGIIEQVSIPGVDDNAEYMLESGSQVDSNYTRTIAGSSTPSKIVDLYNRQSKYTEDSLAVNKDPQIDTKSSRNTAIGFANDVFESDVDGNSNFKISTPGTSSDKDLFVIYQDSESSHTDKGDKEKNKWQKNTPREVLVESVMISPKNKKDEKAIHPPSLHKKDEKATHPSSIHPSNYPSGKKPKLQTSETNDIDDEPNKPSLIIDLPNVKSSSITVQKSGKGEMKPIDSKHELNITDPKDKTTSSEHRIEKGSSHHRLSRVGANVLLTNIKDRKEKDDVEVSVKPGQFGLEYILNAVHAEDPDHIKIYNTMNKIGKSKSDEAFTSENDVHANESTITDQNDQELDADTYSPRPKDFIAELNVAIQIDSPQDNEQKIQYLTTALQNIEKDYKKKIEAIKAQYDSNIKSIINEHNLGVKSIQSLHEETLQDIIKMHENEVENLRSMSIEAMRKAEKLEKENASLKTTIRDCCACIHEEPVKIASSDLKRRRSKQRGDTCFLSKTNVEAFNVKPKPRAYGPCTCSLDVNISDTIRNIFQQVDLDQRKMAEQTYLKYIAKKILNGAIEALDSQELSFLHLKVCRSWKTKIGKEEVLQKRIDSLENELMNKQRHAQEHIAELDRKVAEERRRLEEVREAVCGSPRQSGRSSPVSEQLRVRHKSPMKMKKPPGSSTPTPDLVCKCASSTNMEVSERKSAGDLLPGISCQMPRIKRIKENNRAVLAKLDLDERRDRKLYNDEPPTRLRRASERAPHRQQRK